MMKTPIFELWKSTKKDFPKKTHMNKSKNFIWYQIAIKIAEGNNEIFF